MESEDLRRAHAEPERDGDDAASRGAGDEVEVVNQADVWWKEKIRVNVQQDRDSDAGLAAAGWRVLRFCEHEDAARAALKIARVVKLRPARVVGSSPGTRPAC
jgi:G:T-mismatch repair DNA endonuclease (very short patch repair protein)